MKKEDLSFLLPSLKGNKEEISGVFLNSKKVTKCSLFIALKGKNYVIENIDIKDRYLHTLPCKIKGALLVMPNEYYEGFFICKIKKC